MDSEDSEVCCPLGSFRALGKFFQAALAYHCPWEHIHPKAGTHNPTRYLYSRKRIVLNLVNHIKDLGFPGARLFLQPTIIMSGKV